MNVIRWIFFWPIAVIFGSLTAGTLMILGGLLVGYWWFTACLVITASMIVQPVVSLIVAGVIAPKTNKYVAWSILGPYALIALSAMYTVFGLLFRGYEGMPVENPLFGSVSPWCLSLCSNLGLMWGYGLASTIWDQFSEARKQYVAECDPHPMSESHPATTSVRHHAGVLQRH